MDENLVPTRKQIDFFNRLKLEPPPTRDACQYFIVYLLKGNNAAKDNRAARIVKARNYQKKYLGRSITVLVNGSPQPGTIAYLLPKPGETADRQHSFGADDDEKFLPALGCRARRKGGCQK